MSLELKRVKNDISSLQRQIFRKADDEEMSNLRRHVNTEVENLGRRIDNIQSDFDVYKRQNDEALAQLRAEFEDYKEKHP